MTRTPTSRAPDTPDTANAPARHADAPGQGGTEHRETGHGETGHGETGHGGSSPAGTGPAGDMPAGATGGGARADGAAARARSLQDEVHEVASLELPEPSPAEADWALDEQGEDFAGQIRARMAELDPWDATSVLHFGARAQAELQEVSRTMLSDIRNKDLGPAGDALGEMVGVIGGFSPKPDELRRTRRLWEKVTGRPDPYTRFTARYARVQDQVDRIADSLLEHEHRLLKDIRALDLLYQRTLDYYDELALYIAAGAERLRVLDEEEIPAAEAEAARAGDMTTGDMTTGNATTGNAQSGDTTRGPGDAASADAPADGAVAAQALRDLRAARDDLDRRVHDLKLTRQVVMQSLPSIRLVQENDKALVSRISSTLVNTVPLWETQLAQAITLQRASDAAGAVRAANDLTNRMLRDNAARLQQTNRAIRTEMERGVFDIDAVREANETLIATVEESLTLADSGRARRTAAEQELTRMAEALQDRLTSANARLSEGREARDDGNGGPAAPGRAGARARGNGGDGSNGGGRGPGS